MLMKREERVLIISIATKTIIATTRSIGNINLRVALTFLGSAPPSRTSYLRTAGANRRAMS